MNSPDPKVTPWNVLEKGFNPHLGDSEVCSFQVGKLTVRLWTSQTFWSSLTFWSVVKS